jgi:hypothetical protein
MAAAAFSSGVNNNASNTEAIIAAAIGQSLQVGGSSQSLTPQQLQMAAAAAFASGVNNNTSNMAAIIAAATNPVRLDPLARTDLTRLVLQGGYANFEGSNINVPTLLPQHSQNPAALTQASYISLLGDLTRGSSNLAGLAPGGISSLLSGGQISGNLTGSYFPSPWLPVNQIPYTDQLQALLQGNQSQIGQNPANPIQQQQSNSSSQLTNDLVTQLLSSQSRGRNGDGGSSGAETAEEKG